MKRGHPAGNYLYVIQFQSLIFQPHYPGGKRADVVAERVQAFRYGIQLREEAVHLLDQPIERCGIPVAATVFMALHLSVCLPHIVPQPGDRFFQGGDFAGQIIVSQRVRLRTRNHDEGAVKRIQALHLSAQLAGQRGGIPWNHLHRYRVFA